MIVRSDFRPAWWLPGPHAQTLWPHLLRRPRVVLHRERLELPDGDFLDLDWNSRERGPLALVLHGLEGSSRSGYARGLLRELHDRGLRGVLMHFRGCSGEPNRLARSYHSGETGDLAHVVRELRRREPHTPLGVVGFSLGGNVLLKWLGETGARREAPLVQAAVAVSVPFMLADAAARLERGTSRLYQWALLRTLRRSLRRKLRLRGGTLDARRLRALRSFRAFDEHVTAPLHGFAGADEYYRLASSRQYLRDIRVPTLILHARDDPFMSADCIPAAAELSPQVRLELAERGGHVGFVSGRWPWRPHYWLEPRIADHLGVHLADLARETAA
ncbi:hydrolase [Ectothiorhodospiraceae bacterium 2226]|nr:hydrolase [Ectothiorhodospiraceae bacterium 2226]